MAGPYSLCQLVDEKRLQKTLSLTAIAFGKVAIEAICIEINKKANSITAAPVVGIALMPTGNDGHSAGMQILEFSREATKPHPPEAPGTGDGRGQCFSGSIYRADNGLWRGRNPASIRITEVCHPRTLHNEAFAIKTLFGMVALSATEGAG